jgi:hypothetical protein
MALRSGKSGGSYREQSTGNTPVTGRAISSE